MIKYIIDAVVLVASVGSSFAWNIAFKGLTMATSKYFSMGKDVTNAALIAFSSVMGKDSLKPSGTQNGISSTLGTYFSAWTGMGSGYITSIFTGASDDTSIDVLKTLTSNGSMLLLSPKVDLSGMTYQAQKILYGQLIPAAWAPFPDTFYPRILRKAAGCSKSIDQQILGLMDDSTLVGGYVCYNNDAFYVISVSTTQADAPFKALPGGEHQTLNGEAWGGVTLEDIVESSLLTGGTEGDVVFENGIRAPGFFNLPICDNIGRAVAAIQSKETPSGKYWPCDAPEGSNAGGTNVHVNNGYINVNGQSLWKSQTKYTNIADQSTGNITATIYAQFDGDDKTSYKVTPGCKLECVWPRAYGDVYFGYNNCLYVSTGTNIDGQCCTETTMDSVVNRYYGY